MGSFITKLVFPNRQELRIKNSERKKSWLKRPSKGRESQRENPNVKSKAMLHANEETVVGKARVSKTKNVASPNSEAKQAITFGRGSKASKKKLEAIGTCESNSGIYKKADIMFGGSIGDFVDENGVNKFVKWSVEALVSTGAGVRTDALYRASGGQEDIGAIARQGERGMQDALNREPNIHVLTGALKMFFRNLKEPILNIKDFQEVLEANTENVETVDLLSKVISEKLCREERATLAFLLLHLSSVLQFPENHMSVEAMGVVFGPTLMRPSDGDVINMQADMKRMDRLVQLLLTHCHFIFGPRRPSQVPHRRNKRPPPPPPVSKE